MADFRVPGLGHLSSESPMDQPWPNPSGGMDDPPLRARVRQDPQDYGPCANCGETCRTMVFINSVEWRGKRRSVCCGGCRRVAQQKADEEVAHEMGG